MQASSSSVAGDGSSLHQQQSGAGQTAFVAAMSPHVALHAAGGASSQSESQSPMKEVNIALQCRVGQEHVHDIVQRTSELFNILKSSQVPNNTLNLQLRTKLDEILRDVQLLFTKLRIMYDTVVKNTPAIDSAQIESLIPFVGMERDEQAKATEVYLFVTQEHQEVVELIRLRNRQLKEIIDQMRNIIWEVNTMVTMRTVCKS